MSRKLILLTILTSMLISGCGDSSDKPKPQADVFVSVQPLAWLAERIAGEELEISTIVDASQDPHTFTPSAKQILNLAGGKIFFTINLPLEQTISNKVASASNSLRVVDLTDGMDLLHSDCGGVRDHDHSHSQGLLDPHIWMSPKLSKVIARRMCKEFCKLKPEAAEIFQANCEKLITDLDNLDKELASSLKHCKGKTIFVFHPAFGYFARDFGLHQKAVETGGKKPSMKNIMQLVAQARAQGVKIIFVQKQFSPSDAKLIAKQIGGTVAIVDPLSKDYILNLRALAGELKEAAK